MTRIKDCNGVVHFRHVCNPDLCLCGKNSFEPDPEMLIPDEIKVYKETSDPVTCPDCAKVVCAIRNEPYNTLVAEVDDATLDKGIFAAVEPYGPVGDKGSAASAPSDAERPSLTGGNLEDRDPLR